MSPYIDEKRLPNLIKWLSQQGASVLASTNEYELVRFECHLGTGVLYKGKKGQSVSGPLVTEAILAFKGKTDWIGKGPKMHRMNQRQSKSRRLKIIERDGDLCFYCGGSFDDADLSIEHFIPLTAGGNNHMSNLAIACTTCNVDADCMSVVEKCELREARRRLADIEPVETKIGLLSRMATKLKGGAS